MTDYALTQVKAETLAFNSGVWNMDETSGIYAYDNSANQNKGTATGTTIVNGVFGKARSFNGSSDYISIPDDSCLNPSTEIVLECWIKTNGQTGMQTLIDKRAANGGYALTLSGGSFPLDLNFILVDGAGITYTLTASGVIPNNTNKFIVANYDSEFQGLYVDGVLVKSADIGFIDHHLSASNLIFGANVNLASGFYKGILDEVRIYFQALDQITITDKFNADISTIAREWIVDRTNGESAHKGQLLTTSSVFNYVSQLQAGYNIRMWRGFTTAQDELVCNGIINVVDKSGADVTIYAYSKMINLVKENFSHTYLKTDATAGKPSAIAIDIVDTYGGLNADTSSVQDSGASPVFDSFECINTSPFERCKTIMDALNWQQYYRDDTDFYYAEPRGFNKNTNTLNVGTEIIEMPKWNTDTTEMINNMIISGQSQQTSTIETFTAGAGQTIFQLTFPPLNPQVTVNGTLKVGGLPGAVTSQDYNIDILRAQIVFVSALTGGEAVVVTYSYQIPTTVIKSDINSQALYSTYTKPLQFDDIKSVADAEARINQLLPKYSKQFNYTTLKIRNTAALGIRVGQSIPIIDSFQNVNITLEINRHVIRFPSKWDELTVGDREWKTSQWQAAVENSLKRINEQSQSNTQAYLQVVEVSQRLKLRPDTYWINKRTISGGASIFILGDPNFGILGTSQLGDNTNNSIDLSSNIFLVKNRDDNFRCYFNSMSYFNDTSVSTAVWDTALNQFTFTSGQIIQTKKIQYCIGSNILNVLVFAPLITGTLTWQASNDDGSTWETITPNLLHTFVTVGQKLKLKITESGGGAATVKIFVKVTSGY